MLTVQQGTDPLHFTYHSDDGSNLVALALGTNGCPAAVLISMNHDPEDSGLTIRT